MSDKLLFQWQLSPDLLTSPQLSNNETWVKTRPRPSSQEVGCHAAFPRQARPLVLAR